MSRNSTSYPRQMSRPWIAPYSNRQEKADERNNEQEYDGRGKCNLRRVIRMLYVIFPIFHGVRSIAHG